MYKLKYLVLHCTATKMGVEVKPQDIIRWHTLPKEKGGRGWSKVGYNRLFMLDGSVYDFYPENGDDVVDVYERAFGVWGIGTFECHHWCYVGGLNAVGAPMDTRNELQLLSMEQELKKYVELHPDILIMGHCQYAVFDKNGKLLTQFSKACPCFWVPDYLDGIGIPEKNIFTADPYRIKDYLRKVNKK